MVPYEEEEAEEKEADIQSDEEHIGSSYKITSPSRIPDFKRNILDSSKVASSSFGKYQQWFLSVEA